MHKKGKSSDEMPSISGKELEMISLAVDLAEQQLRDGTASSQIITHYLKLAGLQQQLEIRKMEKEIALLEAKTDEIQSAADAEKMYADAIAAMTQYKGG